jgi:glycosyltransferase involved in cell wall biosynthesis
MNRCDVLIVTPTFTKSSGGVEVHVHETVDRLRHSNLAVAVATTDYGQRDTTVDPIEGVSVEQHRAWPTGSDLCLAPGIVSTIVRRRPRLVHVQGVHTLVAPLAMLTALARRVPYVVTFHTGGHSSAGRRRMRSAQWRILAPLLRRASALIAVSQFERAAMAEALRLPARRIQVLPNGVESVPPRSQRDPDIPLRVLSIGRLEEYKGHDRVLACWAAVQKDRPDAELVIVGSGPDAARLRLLIDQQSLKGVSMLSFGAAQRGAYFEFLVGATVAVFMSEYESQGIAAHEALACGLKLVVRDDTALAELADRGWALGVDPDASAEDLAAAIELAATSAPAIADLPTWDDCARELLALYRRFVPVAL